MICLPLLIYLLSHPASADQRLEQVAVADLPSLLRNLGAWLRVWFTEGASDPVYNLPGRPLLDLPLALLFFAGIGGLVTWVKRDRALWLVLLIGGSIAPALLTDDPLKWLRAIGLNVPLAILLGIGAVTVERLVRWIEGGSQTRPYNPIAWGWAQRMSHRTMGAPLLPIILVAFAGANTLRDFNTWVSSPDLFIPMEQHIYHAIDWLAENAPADAPVYFSPFSADHPVLVLREWRLGDRPVGAFEAVSCLAIPDAPEAYYFALTLYDPGFADRLGQWAQVDPVYTADPRYVIDRAVPHADLFDRDLLDFGDQIGARVLTSPPATASAGASIDLTFELSALGTIDRAYTLFVHLYKGTDLDQGITLISQIDQPICPSDPPARWRPDERILQTYSLPIPVGIEPGSYTVAFGIYDSATVTRLPVGSTDYAVIGTLEVQ